MSLGVVLLGMLRIILLLFDSKGLVILFKLHNINNLNVDNLPYTYTVIDMYIYIEN